jgi:hypothetical protein
MKKIRKTINFFLFAFVVLFSLQLESCEKDKISGDIKSDPQIISQLYSESVDTLTFESDKYSIEVELSRDFFPGGPIQRKKPLVVSIYLVNTDSLPVSKNIEIKQLFVINNQQVWIAGLSDWVQTGDPDYKLGKLNNNGPEWETGIYVDVILEIGNKLTKQIYYLIARQQYIQRLD